jgi:hypothetical protein
MCTYGTKRNIRTIVGLLAVVCGFAALTPRGAAAQSVSPNNNLKAAVYRPVVAPAPHPLLPAKLEFDTKRIGFRNGVPVGGWSHLTLYADGRYHFTGHFHVSGAPSYKVGLVWMVRSATGQVFQFTKQGKLHGTFDSGSRDCDWDLAGNNEDVRRAWADITRSWHANWKADVNFDLNGLIDQVKKLVEVAGQVVKIVQVVSA